MQKRHPLQLDDLSVTSFDPHPSGITGPLSAPAGDTPAAQQAMTGTDSCWGSWCYPQTMTDPTSSL